jgi:hypothetical protein
MLNRQQTGVSFCARVPMVVCFASPLAEMLWAFFLWAAEFRFIIVTRGYDFREGYVHPPTSLQLRDFLFQSAEDGGGPIAEQRLSYNPNFALSFHNSFARP